MIIILISKDGRTLEVQLTRKNVKNINLRVKSDGSIHISANKRTNINTIENLVLENFEKILQIQNDFKKCLVNISKFQNGDFIHFLGKKYEILHVISAIKTARIVDDYFEIYSDNFENDVCKKIFLDFLKSEALPIFGKFSHEIYDFFRPFNLKFPIFKYRFMKSRFGSCIPTKNQINLNYYLILAPLDCVYYVILHEYAHFFHQNHSKAFYDFVEIYMPNWKIASNELKKYKF